jgi:uncharacterized protein (TIGR00303 family)
LVVDLGAAVAPAVPHLQLGQAPARCLSSGQALEPTRVRQLLALGQRWGQRLAAKAPQEPLLIAECVPGGTTTAQAVLTGLDLEVEGLVRGSLLEPVHGLKTELVARGLGAAGLAGPKGPLKPGADPVAVLAAVGDPMQALAAGLVLGATGAERPVLLAGGSQMAAVWALALALSPPVRRQALASQVAIGTTAWVAAEDSSDLTLLLQRLGARWQLDPLAFAASLRFKHCRSARLRDYEAGYVKEGVGAGGLALLWELSGRSPDALAVACDQACERLLDDH